MRSFRRRLLWHFTWLSMLAHQAAAQEGLNNLWLGGFEDQSPVPWGGVDLEFLSGSLVISTPTRTIDFKRTNANITNASGDLQFSTNGSYLANATGDTLFNGTGLNPSDYTSTYPEGLLISQACLILPKPEAQDIYFLFHGTVDDQQTSLAYYLYLTTIVSWSRESGQEVG